MEIEDMFEILENLTEEEILKIRFDNELTIEQIDKQIIYATRDLNLLDPTRLLNTLCALRSLRKDAIRQLLDYQIRGINVEDEKISADKLQKSYVALADIEIKSRDYAIHGEDTKYADEYEKFRDKLRCELTELICLREKREKPKVFMKK